MMRPVRSHRRINRVAEGVTSVALLIGLLACLVGSVAALAGLGVLLGGGGFLLLSLAGVAGTAAFRRLRELSAAREWSQWLSTAGWEPALLPQPWPWQDLVRWADTVTVLRAYVKRVEGFPVRAGDLEFSDNALGAAVDRGQGRAAFAIVALPQPAPALAVRAHRHPARRRAGEDEFRRRFLTLGTDPHRLEDPELRAAHVRGDIPPWTLVDDALFVFVPVSGPLRPRDLERAAEQALRVVDLLQLLR